MPSLTPFSNFLQISSTHALCETLINPTKAKYIAYLCQVPCDPDHLFISCSFKLINHNTKDSSPKFLLYYRDGADVRAVAVIHIYCQYLSLSHAIMNSTKVEMY